MQPLAVTVCLGVRVCASREGGASEVGRCHQQDNSSWLCQHQVGHTGGINGVRKQPCSPSITSDQDPFVS